MAKKNIVIMLIMAVLLVGSVLFADTISFNESKDVAFNLQGYINVYENSSIHHRAAFEEIIVKIYLRDADGIETTKQYSLITDSNGNYFKNFDSSDLNNIYMISVNFRGSIYYANYDYNVDQFIRIDINWWKAF